MPLAPPEPLAPAPPICWLPDGEALEHPAAQQPAMMSETAIRQRALGIQTLTVDDHCARGGVGRI